MIILNCITGESNEMKCARFSLDCKYCLFTNSSLTGKVRSKRISNLQTQVIKLLLKFVSLSLFISPNFFFVHFLLIYPSSSYSLSVYFFLSFFVFFFSSFSPSFRKHHTFIKIVSLIIRFFLHFLILFFWQFLSSSFSASLSFFSSFASFPSPPPS